MNQSITPYPGLRPFTEEESIFFKGRDVHIRMLAKLLETKKMAFITGASGDGKSSMVYAGVIPYIRAGFLKAKFNNWIIFDFKPQRNPLRSLCDAMSQQTGIDTDYLYKEFDNGFSSIIEVYKSNGLYAEGDNAVNEGKNLLIIADQFEEVFTNKDNFDDGTPSLETYTTVNLLLETVRIAVAEDLPVYVAFTMRSDFISQCTVFKSLPEFIAYSQFFVPQLKREEITQVIEQPAILAGSSVSSRLTDVLVNNLGSGFDQLPVLQHTMNLLWRTANYGAETLDLIHLAKIAGIPKDVLDDKDAKEFDSWFAKQPDIAKKYFSRPSLNNVLNAHAGFLYESAYDFYQKNAPWAPKNITKEDSELIIKTAFKSLVKIDNARPVRNRCTLDEITGSVNRDNVNNAVVCGCLNIFRQPQHTLLRPFAESESIEDQYLGGDAVLDITHEALIRNWKMLAVWNAEEEIFVKDYYDFKSQMTRWTDNDRKPNFLLAEGNLVYFETWKNNCNLNPYWIAKYDTSKATPEQKLLDADEEYKNSCDFLRESRDALTAAQNRRKNRQRIILIAALAVMTLLAGFTFWALQERTLAQKETARANEQTKEAKLQMDQANREKNRAEEAEKRAGDEKRKAYNEAKKAREAKEAAERASAEAINARNIADSMTTVALRNLRAADSAKYQTELALIDAEEQRKKADRASDSATRLFYTAVSNALAMKAQNHYEDKSLNLRLAWSSWLMCRDCGITKNTAELYQAMLFAMKENGFDNRLEVTNDKIADFCVAENNDINVLTDRPEIIQYRISGDKPQEINRFACDGVLAPVEKAFFVSGDIAVLSTKDRQTYVVNIPRQTTTRLPRNGGYLTAAHINPDGKLAMASGIGVLDVWDLQGSEPKLLKTINLGGKISDLQITSDGKTVYALTLSGAIVECNVEGGATKTLLDKRPINAYSMALLENAKLLVTSFSDGQIRYYSLENQSTFEVLGTHARPGVMAYDPNTHTLARASDDKRVIIIDTENFMSQPYTLEEYNLNGGKAISLKFNHKGVLYVLTDHNELRYFDTDIRQYANSLATLNLAPLNEMEKRMLLGREMSGDIN